jgi:TIGR03009 family protein
MSLSRCGLVSELTWCLLGAAVWASVAVGQETPRRTAAPPARANNQSSGGRQSAPVYGPQREPQRQAAAPRINRDTPLNRFAPQPRQPSQPSWGRLTPQENAELELVLRAWEEGSSKVSTLECTFQCWKYDKVFGNRIIRGVIKYAAPDKGHYHVTEEAKDPKKDPLEFIEKEGEYWVCDGNAVYEYDYQKQQVIERRLPNELKGKAISNSPLPFVFGSTAAKMRERYWMRLITPKEVVGSEIWLKVEPIYTEDRANYQDATVIFDEKRMLPKALGLTLPNGSATNYMFDLPSINNPLKKLIRAFEVPRTPSGWKRIVEEPPKPGGRSAPPDDVQTLRVPKGVQRK